MNLLRVSAWQNLLSNAMLAITMASISRALPWAWSNFEVTSWTFLKGSCSCRCGKVKIHAHCRLGESRWLSKFHLIVRMAEHWRYEKLDLVMLRTPCVTVPGLRPLSSFFWIPLHSKIKTRLFKSKMCSSWTLCNCWAPWLSSEVLQTASSTPDSGCHPTSSRGRPR